MTADLSRDTFDPRKRHAGVVMQQGRVQLDADWNEEADQVLRYLATNPQSADTLDGITEWWLLCLKIRTTVPRIKRALAHLVRRGLLLKQKATDGRTHYRLNRLKTRAIGRYLNPATPKRTLKRVDPHKT